jgi:hypothetical protein
VPNETGYESSKIGHHSEILNAAFILTTDRTYIGIFPPQYFRSKYISGPKYPGMVIRGPFRARRKPWVVPPVVYSNTHVTKDHVAHHWVHRSCLLLPVSQHPMQNGESDLSSLFTYDNDVPDVVDLAQLRLAVGQCFKVPCTLEKIAEGGYHKVHFVTCLFKTRFKLRNVVRFITSRQLVAYHLMPLLGSPRLLSLVIR